MVLQNKMILRAESQQTRCKVCQPAPTAQEKREIQAQNMAPGSMQAKREEKGLCYVDCVYASDESKLSL